jgi:hypothetical protein
MERLVEMEEEGLDTENALVGVEVDMRSLDNEVGRACVEMLSCGWRPRIGFSFMGDRNVRGEVVSAKLVAVYVKNHPMKKSS